MAIVTAEEFFKGGNPKKATVVSSAPQQNEQQAPTGDGYLSRVKESVVGGVKGAIQAERDSISGKANPIYAGFDIAKNISSAAISPIAEAPGFKQLGEGFNKVGQAIVDTKVGNAVTDKLADSFSPETLGAASNVVETGMNVTGLKGGAQGFKSAKNTTSNIFDTLATKSPKLSEVPNFRAKTAEFLSSDVDGKTASILKETPTPVFEQYLEYAREAASHPRKFTPFDYVGDSMVKSLKILKEELSKVGEAKSEFTQPLRQGFDPFNGKSLVNDLTSLHNKLPAESRPFVRKLIEKAKSVKTKYDADRLIDEIQEDLKTWGAQNIIPKGSALQRQVSGVLAKFNNELKTALPKEYRDLNARYRMLKNVTDTMNKALGEVVDGQSVRGGSLVKQFFGPSGKKAKVVFEFIKKETGIDLAQEAVLAKYVMELFDDPRSRSLLEGVPKSASGLIDKAIDFTIEKAGIGQGVRSAFREAEIRKAKSLTK